MKIIQLVYELGQGGAEKFVVNLSNTLALLGHDVEICMLRNDNDRGSIFFSCQFISSKVKYTNLGLTKGFSLKKMQRVSHYIKKSDADIVHCHLNTTPYIFPIAIKRNHIKFIHTIHNIAEKASGAPYQKLINHWFYKTNRIIPVTISEECRNSFIRFYGVNTQIARIDNGTIETVPTKEFDNVSATIKNLNDNNAPVFIHVARFDNQKNQSLLIDTFNILNDEGIDFCLLIIGDGFNSVNGVKLQEKACKKIHFLGLISNVSDYLLNSDYFILSSNFEGLPISLIEAISAGCTPICTAVGGIPDVIEDCKTGFLSPSLKLEDFTNTVKQALKTPLDKQLISSVFTKRFSIEKCAKEYISLFESVQKD